ncbi:MAG: hypothetical protein AAFZ49_12090 [Cyanobacteria bacterium J06659_2]
MFQSSNQDASAPTVSAAETLPNREPLRHILLGSLEGVRSEILNLHKRGHSEPNSWSKPLPTGRPGEVMAILTKYLTRE